jgi:hypothetical protein
MTDRRSGELPGEGLASIELAAPGLVRAAVGTDPAPDPLALDPLSPAAPGPVPAEAGPLALDPLSPTRHIAR